ncbi:MAG: DUF5655 domain-containing protein [Acidimicrobiales bacterium]
MSAPPDVARWVCPDCGRQFGRTRQGHECSPAMALEDYFATGPPYERPIFDAVMAGLAGVGPVHVEPVSVGIFLKRSRTFAELRPMTKWVAVSFALERTLTSARIARKVYDAGRAKYHVVNVRTADEVDDQLLEWLREAYDLSPE